MNIVDSSAKSNMSISAFLISHLMREIVFRQQAGAGLALVHNQSVCTNILLVFVFPLYPFCIEHIKPFKGNNIIRQISLRMVFLHQS